MLLLPLYLGVCRLNGAIVAVCDVSLFICSLYLDSMIERLCYLSSSGLFSCLAFYVIIIFVLIINITIIIIVINAVCSYNHCSVSTLISDTNIFYNSYVYDTCYQCYYHFLLLSLYCYFFFFLMIIYHHYCHHYFCCCISYDNVSEIRR